MKILALVSVVSSGRQARDTQSLFKKMFDDQSVNAERQNIAFPETSMLYIVTQFYMAMKGKILKSFSGIAH